VQRLAQGEPTVAAEGGAGAAADTPLHLRPEQEARLQVDTGAGPVHLLARASDVVLPDEQEQAEHPAVGRMVVLTDITELTRAMRMKTDFVANASHELRTPLAAIRAAVETLLHANLKEDAAAVRRFLKAIERQSGRLEAMVTDLLDLSRLESPVTQFEPQPLHIQRELDEVHTRFAARLESKKLHWEAHALNGTSSTVVAHPHLLRIVLDNLVDNAVKFTDPGGHVRVACASGPGWTSFEVADDGCGIPESEQQRVFERFYQVERARSGNERGTGLGLSIVRHAVAAMKGTVRLESAPQEGTRVIVEIPQPQSGSL
jgi:two-component system phosphate regulon sensor histidine kinase PhoR